MKYLEEKKKATEEFIWKEREEANTSWSLIE